MSEGAFVIPPAIRQRRLRLPCQPPFLYARAVLAGAQRQPQKRHVHVPPQQPARAPAIPNLAIKQPCQRHPQLLVPGQRADIGHREATPGSDMVVDRAQQADLLLNVRVVVAHRQPCIGRIGAAQPHKRATDQVPILEAAKGRKVRGLASRDVGANDCQGVNDKRRARAKHIGDGIKVELALVGVRHVGIEAAPHGTAGHVTTNADVIARGEHQRAGIQPHTLAYAKDAGLHHVAGQHRAEEVPL